MAAAQGSADGLTISSRGVELEGGRARGCGRRQQQQQQQQQQLLKIESNRCHSHAVAIHIGGQGRCEQVASCTKGSAWHGNDICSLHANQRSMSITGCSAPSVSASALTGAFFLPKPPQEGMFMGIDMLRDCSLSSLRPTKQRAC
eukprot:COSAG06_NODE_455_length_15521_cov_8.312022_11_plen_145_part_00